MDEVGAAELAGKQGFEQELMIRTLQEDFKACLAKSGNLCIPHISATKKWKRVLKN